MTMAYPGARARHGENRDKVLFWLEDQPDGTEFHYLSLAEELGIPGPSVNGTLNTLISRDRDKAIVRKGFAHGEYIVSRKHEERAPALSADVQDREVMTVIGFNRNGEPLLKDSSEKIWKAVEL